MPCIQILYYWMLYQLKQHYLSSRKVWKKKFPKFAMYKMYFQETDYFFSLPIMLFLCIYVMYNVLMYQPTSIGRLNITRIYTVKIQYKAVINHIISTIYICLQWITKIWTVIYLICHTISI